MTGRAVYDRIQEIAKERWISLHRIEKEAGLSNGVICKWRTSQPRLESIKKVADALRIDAEELYKLM